MKGLLRAKSPLNQFLLLICISIASLFIVGFVGYLILSKVTGLDMLTMGDSTKWNVGDPRIITMIRGLQIVQFISLFVIPPFLCAKLFSLNSRQYLGLRMPANSQYFIVAIFLILLSLPLVNFLGELNQHVKFPTGIAKWLQDQELEAAKTIRTLLSRHTIGDLILNVTCIAGLAAVGEELLFRGIAQRLLIRIFKSPFIGILIAAFIFSALHMQFYGFLPRFVLGILLGYIYWYSGSLWVSIIAHFVYDAFLIVVVYFNPASVESENTLQLRNLAIAAVVSLAIVTALFQWMRKKTATTFEKEYEQDMMPVKDHPF